MCPTTRWENKETEGERERERKAEAEVKKEAQTDIHLQCTAALKSLGFTKNCLTL